MKDADMFTRKAFNVFMVSLPLGRGVVAFRGARLVGVEGTRWE